MKKLICLLAVMFMAAPVLADMNIVGEDLGSGQLKLSYYTDGGEEPRGVAIKLSMSNNATIEGAVDVLSVNPLFNTNIDYAYEDPCSYNIGDGHPLADPDNPGVPDFGTGISVVTVCMGVLDPCGNQAPAGGGGTAEDPCDLITLQLYDPCEAGSTVVTVSADELRSTTGAVGSTIVVQYPGGVTVTFFTPCFPQDHPDYAQWQLMGELHGWKWGANSGPLCWCNPRQCHGDADSYDTDDVPLQNWEGSGFTGYMYVGTRDKNVLIGAYKKAQPTKGSGIENIAAIDRGTGDLVDGICADFNHLHEGSPFTGYMYVGTKDKNRLIYNYKGNHGRLEPTKGSGVPADYCDPTYPAEYDL